MTVTAQFALTTPAFESGESIPARCTCDGKNRSPELHWTDGPDLTRSFALLVEDPDAPSGTFTHWLLFDIPASVHELAEGDGRRALRGSMISANRDTEVRALPAATVRIAITSACMHWTSTR